MQIVQELCRRPGLNKCGFEMPTIYIPNPQKVKHCVFLCELFHSICSIEVIPPEITMFLVLWPVSHHNPTRTSFILKYGKFCNISPPCRAVVDLFSLDLRAEFKTLCHPWV